MIGVRNHRSERGDTIIEVLISIAIISLVLTVSYGIASHSVRSIQDSQERNQAVQLAQRQVEFLRTNSADFTANNDVCFTSSGNPVDAASAATKCVVSADGTAVGGTPSDGQAAFTITITPPSASEAYTVNLSWDSLLNGSKDNLTVYYRP